MSISVLEVAEAMYAAGKDHPTTHKLPDSLDELSPHTQKRYLLLAGAAVAAMPAQAPVSVPQLVLDLAEQLALKLNHSHSFADDVGEVFDRYAAVVGEDRITDEVRKAMAI